MNVGDPCPPSQDYTLCYLTNVYPAPSHTTMRREIRSLESLGVRVVRAAARRFAGPLVEQQDRDEQARTHYAADSVWLALLCLCRTGLSRPRHLVRALSDAIHVGRTSRAGIWKHLMYVGEAAVLLSSARSCHHIHANFGNATSIAIMARVLGGPEVSLRIHGPEEFDSFSPTEWDWKLRHAAFVAPISDYGVEAVRARVAPRYHAKVQRLRCGIDQQSLTGTVHALPEELRIVCVARLEARKGHEVLLDALARLVAQGVDASLTLVGEGSLTARLGQRARDLRIHDRIAFLGWRDGAGVRDALDRSRVLVLPSWAEGLPIVLMEAMAAGRAVVATRVAGIPELVVPNENGWLVEPGDVAGFAEALREALTSDSQRLHRMASDGRWRVREFHSADLLMAELLDRLLERAAREVTHQPMPINQPAPRRYELQPPSTRNGGATTAS